jgi:hypothetical protein
MLWRVRVEVTAGEDGMRSKEVEWEADNVGECFDDEALDAVLEEAMFKDVKGEDVRRLAITIERV